MQVVHVAPTTFGEGGVFGGGERYPLELARALAEQCDCRLVTFGSDPDRYHVGKLEVVTLRARTLIRDHPARPLGRGLWDAVREADIVHVHHMRSTPSLGLAARRPRRRPPLVVTDHGLQGSDWYGLLPRSFRAFLTVSEASARQLGAPRNKVRVIHGGADLQRFRPNGRVARRGALFVGRITPHKGIDVLLRALPDGVEAIIAGTEGHDLRPPERDYPALLRELARGRDVNFAGTVAEDRLPDLLRRARAVVLPSVALTCYGRPVATSELLGLVPLEAMASGTPVICSRIGGLPEVVENDVTGFLVEPGDVSALRACIERLANDDELVAKMGRAARAHVEARFSWRACAERCRSAYEEVTSGAL